MPKISVIIPVYNVEKYLKECLDSIVNQTLKDIEIICVNDGSTDNSLEILRECAQEDERIIVVDKKNEGAGQARNIGLEIASGDYIIFFDSDDYFSDNSAFEKIYNNAIENSSDIVVFRSNKLLQETGEILNADYSIKSHLIDNKLIFSPKDYAKYAIQVFIGWPWDKLYKKEFILKHKLKYQKLRHSNDTYFVLSSICIADIISIENSCFATHRTHKSSLEATRVKAPDCFYRALVKLKRFLMKNGIFSLYRQSYINYCLEFANWHMSTIKNEEAEKMMFSCFRKLWKSNRIGKLPADYFDDLNLFNTYNEIFINEPSLQKQIFTIMKNVGSTVFSSKNQEKHKILTFLGIKLKIKYDREKVKFLKRVLGKIKNHSILIVEINPFHAETISGYAKYFSELGYNVDILLNNRIFDEKPFVRLDEKYFNNINSCEQNFFEFVLNSKKIKKYDFIFVNSCFLYKGSFRELYPNAKQPKYGYLAQEHRMEVIDKALLQENRVFQLANLKTNEQNPLFCNSHYFGEIKERILNKEFINFITIGEISVTRRDFSVLLNSVQQLINNGYDNFKITVIGRGTLDNLPEKIASKFDIKGRLSYEDMFNEIEKADFFLPLLNPESEEHNRYITLGSSGSFQLIYGFNIPCLIARKFAEVHFFNSENAILYDKNADLFDAMKQAMDMGEAKYNAMKSSLQSTTNYIENESKNNLSNAIKNIIKGSKNA